MKDKAPHYSLLIDSTDQDMTEVLSTVSRKVERSLAKTEEVHHQRLKMIHASRKSDEHTTHHA